MSICILMIIVLLIACSLIASISKHENAVDTSIKIHETMERVMPILAFISICIIILWLIYLHNKLS